MPEYNKCKEYNSNVNEALFFPRYVHNYIPTYSLPRGIHYYLSPNNFYLILVRV